MNIPIKNMERDLGIDQIAPGITATELKREGNITCMTLSDDAVYLGLGDGQVVKLDKSFTEDTVASHTGAVVSLSEGQDGSIFSAGQDGRVMRHCGGDAAIISEDENDWVNALSTSNATGYLAVAKGRELNVFDGDSLMAHFQSPTSTFTDVVFSPDGKELAASCYNGVSLFSTTDPDKADILPWKGSLVEVSWSPDGRFIAAATQDREIHMWDLVDGKDYRLGGFTAKPRQLCWTACSNYLISLGSDVIAAWPLAGGPGAFPPQEIGYASNAQLSAVTAGGAIDRIAGGFSDGSILIGNIRSGEAMIARIPDGASVTVLEWEKGQKTLYFGTAAGNYGAISMPE